MSCLHGGSRQVFRAAGPPGLQAASNASPASAEQAAGEDLCLLKCLGPEVIWMTMTLML